MLAVDWSKKVVTDGSSLVVKLDDNFDSRHGVATLFKASKAPDLTSDCTDWVGYRVHSNGRCYSVYTDQELSFGIRNAPTKHRGWVGIQSTLPCTSAYAIRYCSNIYRTEKECRAAMTGTGVVHYREVEWEEP